VAIEGNALSAPACRRRLDDVSTTTTGWLTSTNDWQEIELDSTDTSVPDDSDLEFHATLRFRTSTIVPLRYEE